MKTRILTLVLFSFVLSVYSFSQSNSNPDLKLSQNTDVMHFSEECLPQSLNSISNIMGGWYLDNIRRSVYDYQNEMSFLSAKSNLRKQEYIRIWNLLYADYIPPYQNTDRFINYLPLSVINSNQTEQIQENNDAGLKLKPLKLDVNSSITSVNIESRKVYNYEYEQTIYDYRKERINEMNNNNENYSSGTVKNSTVSNSSKNTSTKGNSTNSSSSSNNNNGSKGGNNGSKNSTTESSKNKSK
jgi:hypothetical protein